MQSDKAELAEPTGPSAPPGSRTGRHRRAAISIAGGATLVASLTALSRVLGLGRTLVFSQSVGSGCLGTAYVTANQVPNLIYELAIGGALTSAMIPVLAGPAARAFTDPEAKERVARITSALLTWGVVLLVPVTVAAMAAAHPIASLLIPANPNADCSRPEMVNATALMIVIFAPQIFFYGISVVLIGLLTAYRRFTGPALGPVIANFVMISSYLAFAKLDHGRPLGSTPLSAELVLSIGTTLNIATLVVVALPPTWRLRLRLRPTLAFPPGVISQVGGLALVGVLEFLAVDVTSVVIIALANGHGDTGALVLNNYAVLVFTSMCSVLPGAIVISVFPALAAAKGAEFDRTSAGSTRAVVLVSWLSSAVMVAVCFPAAHVLAKPDQVTQLAQGFLLSAPGIVGIALVTMTSRVMFAIGKLRASCIGLVGGPLLQALLSVILVELVPARLVVAALSLASTLAMLGIAVPMVLLVRRFCGPAPIAGLGHVNLSGIAAFAAASAVGLGVTLLAPEGGKAYEGAIGAVSTVLAVLVFFAVAYALDKGDLHIVASRLNLRRFAPFVR